MDEQHFQHYLNDLQQPHASLWWPKTIAICALIGGLYGASLGAALGAVPGAADVIGIAASVLAILCGPPGARYGFFFGMVNRSRFGSAFGGTVAAIAGAMLGGFLATMVLLALGAILGTVAGWFIVQALLSLRKGLAARFFGGLAGAFVGMFVGAVLWAMRLNQPAAIVGASWGFGIGAVIGPLLLVAFIKALGFVLSTRIRHRPQGDSIDTTFRREE